MSSNSLNRLVRVRAIHRAKEAYRLMVRMGNSVPGLGLKNDKWVYRGEIETRSGVSGAWDDKQIWEVVLTDDGKVDLAYRIK